MDKKNYSYKLNQCQQKNINMFNKISAIKCFHIIIYNLMHSSYNGKILYLKTRKTQYINFSNVCKTKFNIKDLTLNNKIKYEYNDLV